MAGMMRKRSRPAVIDPMVVEELDNALPRTIMMHNQHRTSRSRNLIHTVSILRSSLIFLILNAMTIQIAQSFTFHRQGNHIINQRTMVGNRLLPSSLFGITAPTTNTNINEDSNTKSDRNIDAQRYKEEAAKIRLEAERMDLELAIIKMQTIQKSIDKLIKKQNQQIDSGSSNNTKANHIRESIDQLEEQIRTLQKKIGTKDIENAASILELSNETTTLDLYNSGSISSTASNGTFVATATTMGRSDVPLVVSMDKTADTIVFTSSGSVLTTPTSTRDTTTSSSATSTITRPSSRINVVPKTPATLLPRKSSASALSESTTEVTKQHRSNHDMDEDNNSNNISTATIYGFDKADLDLYLPVAVEIEATMSNATAEERLEKFRTSPLLQTNFQTKLTQMFVEPIQEMNRMQELKQEYLDSTSSKEKELLKRQIDTISKTVDADGPFLYSDSVYRPTPDISADDINERVAAMQTLPEILQTIYKQRYNLDSTANLTLAILLDHYEIQLQLLEQIKLLRQPFTTEVRQQIVQAIESLPIMVQSHVATVLGLKPEEYSIDDLIVELSKDDDESDEEEDWWDQLFDTAPIKSKPSASKSSPLTVSPMDWSVSGDVSNLDEEGNDIEMIDRSRYVYDLYPAIARMEQEMIAYDTVDQISKVLFNSKKSFMVTNKLERVVGGYYIRGRNLLDEDQSGIKLMEHIQRTLSTTNVTFDEEFEYFYLRDPAPLTDEEIELEYRNDPVFAITGKNVTLFYDNADPLTKAMVTLAAFTSMGLLAIDNYHMGPILLNQLESYVGLASVTTTNDIDVAIILSNLGHVMIPLTMLQLVHETGHRIIAWKDKFNVGVPTFIPSIQLGCLGSVTPLTSPPPSLKSMFDFGMSGPLFGLFGSFALLAFGLQSTSSMDMNQLASQPSIPTSLLRSSTLGGAFIEWFLGPGSLIPDLNSPSLPLHPFAIAGYIGMISNALALLPLGNTDGGRIAISMFGRRGTFIVRTLVAAMLCSAGLFGLDDSGILLNYIVIVFLFQDEIETPARNEVEELDFGRGCFGIGMAALVLMMLLPMQS